MSDWETTTLGDLCRQGGGAIQTGPFGSQLHAHDYVAEGVPSVMPQNIGENVISEEGIARISDADAQRLAKYLLQPGDIVYSRRGDVEKRALVRSHNAGWLCGTGCLRVRLGHRSTHDPRFVSYLLGMESARAWIVRHAVGATMPNLNTSILSALPLAIPEPAEQRAIAEVLGALDDKIAANTRLATTADEWVRATWARTCVNADTTRPVASLADSIRDVIDPRDASSDHVYVGLEHMPRRQMWLPDHGLADSVTSAKSGFLEGDVLFGKLRPYFHKVVAAPKSGICSTDVLVLRAQESTLRGFVLAALASDATVAAATASSEGTRMPRASWRDLAAIEVPWPGSSAAEAFSSEVEALRATVDARLAENLALAATRDALLPALMSGALCVRDAERAVESVV